MVSDLIIEILTPFFGSSVNMYGLTLEAIITIFAIVLAIAFALRIEAKSGHKEAGLGAFFGILIILAFFTIVSWFVVAIPLMLTALYFFYTKRGVS